jgi:hypothetical protein
MPLVTAVTKQEEPEAPTLEEVFASVEDVLKEHPELSEDSRNSIRASIRVDLPLALQRKRVRDFWRGFARRNGLRAAERVSGITRWRLVLVMADLETEQPVYGTLHQCLGAAIDYDDEVTAKEATVKP